MIMANIQCTNRIWEHLKVLSISRWSLNLSLPLHLYLSFICHQTALAEENEHIRNALMLNDYLEWMFSCVDESHNANPEDEETVKTAENTEGAKDMDIWTWEETEIPQ